MSARELLDRLLRRPAILPGCRDLQGRPVLFVFVPAEGALWQDHDLTAVVQYLVSIPKDTESGFCVVLDARAGSGRALRCVQRALAPLRYLTGCQVTVRPETFWQKQTVACGRAEHDVEAQQIPLSKLRRYIAPEQTPAEFGGTFPYNHERWIEHRLKLEAFVRDSGAALEDLKRMWLRLLPAESAEPHQIREMIAASAQLYRSVVHTPDSVSRAGEELLRLLDEESQSGHQMSPNAQHGNADSRRQRSEVEQRLKDLSSHGELLRDAWAELHRALSRCDEQHALWRRADAVIGWVLGPGERLLAAQELIGRDLPSSERLIEVHDRVELQCRDAYAEFANVRHQLDEVLRSPDDLGAAVVGALGEQRQYLETVCRCLASRLERRKHLLFTAARFYRLLQTVSDQCQVLLEAADEGVESLKVLQIGEKLGHMQVVADETERAFAELNCTGEKLQDMLILPVKNASGQDITPDYRVDLERVSRLTGRTHQHVQTVLETWGITKLRLQQTLQLAQCQTEAEQALVWLTDLSGLMLRRHSRVGRTNTEIQLLKRQHQDFEDTAKSTYEYGVESCAAAGRLGGDEVSEELRCRLEEAWMALKSCSQEQITRLRVAAVFHRTADEQIQRLRHWSASAAAAAAAAVAPRSRRASSVASSPRSSPSAGSDVVLSSCGGGWQPLGVDGRTFLRDVGRTVRLGKLLRERLQEQHADGSDDSDSNTEARAAISAKLAEIGLLSQHVEAQCRRRRDDCVDTDTDDRLEPGPVMESSPVSRDSRDSPPPAEEVARRQAELAVLLQRSTSVRSVRSHESDCAAALLSLDSDCVTALGSLAGSETGVPAPSAGPLTGSSLSAPSAFVSAVQERTSTAGSFQTASRGPGDPPRDSSPDSQQDTEPPSLGEDWNYDCAEKPPEATPSAPDGQDPTLPGWAAWRSKSRTPSLEKLLDDDFPPLVSFGSNFSRSSSSAAVSELPADNSGGSGDDGQLRPETVTPKAGLATPGSGGLTPQPGISPRHSTTPEAAELMHQSGGLRRGSAGRERRDLRRASRQSAGSGTSGTATTPTPMPDSGSDAAGAVVVVSSPALYKPEREEIRRRPSFASRLKGSSGSSNSEDDAPPPHPPPPPPDGGTPKKRRRRDLEELASRISGLDACVHSVEAQLAQLEAQLPDKNAIESRSEEVSESELQSDAVASSALRDSDDPAGPPSLPARESRLSTGSGDPRQAHGPAPVYENVSLSQSDGQSAFLLEYDAEDLVYDSVDSALSMTPPNAPELAYQLPMPSALLDVGATDLASLISSSTDPTTRRRSRDLTVLVATSALTVAPPMPPAGFRSSVADAADESAHPADVSGTGDEGMVLQYAQPATVVDDDLSLDMQRELTAEHEGVEEHAVEDVVDEAVLQMELQQSREWVELKVLEMTPELTHLGSNLEEALDLQTQHEEVLQKLASKQSPVEELLNQADHLIANQKPKAEVYSAMAESLGLAWRDLNAQLESRRHLLQRSVDFHSRTRHFGDSMDLAERVFGDVSIPAGVDEARAAIKQLNEVKKAMLEASMVTLQEGNHFLERLRKLAQQGTIDSRPKHIRSSVQSACARVERWLEELHDRRRCLEALFSGRRLVLDQCLSLSQLYADLGGVQTRAELIRRQLAGSCRLGESPETAAALLREHEKIELETKSVQDRALHLLHTADALVRSGTYARDEPRTRAYAVLEICAQLSELAERRRGLLSDAHRFFQQAQQTFSRLSSLESELGAAPPAEQARVHAETAAALEKVALPALQAGNQLLDQTGRGADGTEGVSECVAELQRRVDALSSLCTAHQEEDLRRTQLYAEFLDKYNKLFGWMVGEAETFLRTHTDMGDGIDPAQQFASIHQQIQQDLQSKRSGMDELLAPVGSMARQLDPDRGADVTRKADEMRAQWDHLNAVLHSRGELAERYVSFHRQAGVVRSTLDDLTTTLARPGLTDADIKLVEDKWLKMQQQYHALSTVGKEFTDRAQQITDPYLDVKRACRCVESTLERLRADQLRVTETYEHTQLTITQNKQLQKDWEQCKQQSKQTLEEVVRLRSDLYPVLRETTSSLHERQQQCERMTKHMLPRLQSAREELDTRVRTAEKLRHSGDTQGEAESLIGSLTTEREELSRTSTEYQTVLQMMTSYVKNLQELDSSIDSHRATDTTRAPPSEPSECQKQLNEHDATQRAFNELVRITRSELSRTEETVRRVEPPAAADHDVTQLRACLDTEINKWNETWTSRKELLERQMTSSVFNSELLTINQQLHELSDQLGTMKGQYGETLREAEQTSRAFRGFEDTIANTGSQIRNFVSTAQTFISDSPEPEKVALELNQLQNKWSSFQCQVGDNRKLIDLSLEYYKLVEEAEDWYKDGGKLLVDIARQTTKIRSPDEAQRLRSEINLFLDTGERKQEDRIKQITLMSEELYGTPAPERVVTVTQQHKEMVESLRTVREELKTLVEKLEERDREKEQRARETETLLRRNTELTETTRIAQQEAEAARAAASAAEEARRAAEAAARALEQMPRPVTPLVVPKMDVSTETIIEVKKSTVDSCTQDTPVGKSDASTQQQRASTTDAATQQLPVGTHDAAVQQMPGTSDAFTQQLPVGTSDAATQQLPVGTSDAFTQNAEVTTSDAATQERISVSVVDSGTDAGVPCPWSEVEERVSRTSSLQRRTKRTEAPMVPPAFVQPLIDQTVQEGVRHTLHTRVTGQPAPKINWQKDGISCDKNGDYVVREENGVCSLTIEETLVEDSATYTCRAWNPAGLTETSARLTVTEPEPEEPLEPPLFTRQLSSLDVKEGRRFQLSATVSGNPLPAVSWSRSGACIDQSADYVITYNNGECSLRVEEAMLQDQGTYSCSASNVLGSDQTVCKVRVEPRVPAEAPRFTVPLSNVMARAGQKLRLECEVEGLPHPDLTWLHNGRPLRESRDTRVTFDGRKATVTIVEAFPKDAGTYVIVAKNSAGEESCSCTVTVKGRIPAETSDSEIASDLEPVKPVIQVHLTDLTVEQGERAQLDCVLTGQPEPEVIWYHEDEPVKESKDFQLLFQGDRCTLVINKAMPGDAGRYSVVAINSAGEATSACALKVLAPRTPTPEEVTEEPRFTRLLTDASAREDERQVLEAEVTGLPEPTVTWLKDGREVKSTESMKITKEGRLVRLEIGSCLPQHAGNYICVATNTAGEARCFSHVVVRPKPAPVEFKRAATPKLEPPTFVQIFKDQHVAEGSDVLFQCIIDGKPKPTVHWNFNDGPLPADAFLPASEGQHHVLRVTASRLSHSGRVKCTAENEIGRATCSAHLTVEEPLKELSLPTVTEKKSTMNKHLAMKKTMYTEVHEETQVVNTNDRNNQETHASVPKPDEQKIHRSTYEEYRQAATSERRTTTQLPTPTPAVPEKPAQAPRYLTPLQGVMVKQGEDVKLEGVYAGGWPLPEIKWFRNGEDFASGGRICTSSDHSRVTLTLPEATEADAGRYTCTLSNTAGTATSTADVVVKKTMFPPVFDHRLKAQLAKPGQRVFLEATVSGTPAPEVVWTKDAQPVDTRRYTVRQEGSRHILVIENAAMEDAGKFSIQATNAAGEATSIADLVVAEELPVLVERRLVTRDLTEQQYKAALEGLASEPAAPPVETGPAAPTPLLSSLPQPATSPHTVQQTTSFTSKMTTEIKSVDMKPQHVLPVQKPPLKKGIRQQTRSVDNTQVQKETNMVIKKVDVNLMDAKKPEPVMARVAIPETRSVDTTKQQQREEKLTKLAQLTTLPQPAVSKKPSTYDSVDHVQETVTRDRVDRTYIIPQLLDESKPGMDQPSSTSAVPSRIPQPFPHAQPPPPPSTEASQLQQMSSFTSSMTTTTGATAPKPSAQPPTAKVVRQQTRSVDNTQVKKETNMVTKKVNVNLMEPKGHEPVITKVAIPETTPDNTVRQEKNVEKISKLTQLTMIPQPREVEKPTIRDNVDHVGETVTKSTVSRTYVIPPLTPDIPPKPEPKHVPTKSSTADFVEQTTQKKTGISCEVVSEPKSFTPERIEATDDNYVRSSVTNIVQGFEKKELEAQTPARQSTYIPQEPKTISKQDTMSSSSLVQNSSVNIVSSSSFPQKPVDYSSRPVYSAINRESSYDQVSSEHFEPGPSQEVVVPARPAVHDQSPRYQFPPKPTTPSNYPAISKPIIPKTPTLSERPPPPQPMPPPVTYVSHTAPPEHHQRVPLEPQTTSTSVTTSQETVSTRSVHEQTTETREERAKQKQPGRRVSDIKKMIEDQIEEVETNGTTAQSRGGVRILPVKTPEVEKPQPSFPEPRETTPQRPFSVASVPFERFPDLEPFPYKPEPPRPQSAKLSLRPPPTPTKFVPGHFTDTETSDFDERIPTRWQADGYEYIDRREISVDLPDVAPRPKDGQKPPTPPSQFERPAEVEYPIRPKLDRDSVPRVVEERPSQTPERPKFTKKTPVETPWVPIKKEKVISAPVRQERLVQPPEIKPTKPVKAAVKQWPPPPPAEDTPDYATQSDRTQLLQSEQNQRQVTETMSHAPVYSKPTWPPASDSSASQSQTSKHTLESSMSRQTTETRTQQQQPPAPVPPIIQPVAIRPPQMAPPTQKQHSQMSMSSQFSRSEETKFASKPSAPQQLKDHQMLMQSGGSRTETKHETSERFMKTETRYESSSMTTTRRTEVVDGHGSTIVPQPVQAQPVQMGGRSVSQSQWSSSSERRETQQTSAVPTPSPVPIVTSPRPSSSSSYHQTSSMMTHGKQTSKLHQTPSPRPSAEGINMQKMWSTKRSEKLSKIWPPPAPETVPAQPVWSQDHPDRPMSAMSYSSTQEERSTHETGGYTSDFAGYASEPELAALAARRPEPYIQRQKPPVAPQQVQQRTQTQQSMSSVKQTTQSTSRPMRPPPSQTMPTTQSSDTEARIPAKWTPSGPVEGGFRPVHAPTPSPRTTPQRQLSAPRPPSFSDGGESPTVVQQRGLRPSQLGGSWQPQQQTHSQRSSHSSVMRQEFHSQRTVVQQQQSAPGAVAGPRHPSPAGVRALGVVNVAPLQSPRPTRPIKPKEPMVLRATPPARASPAGPVFDRFPDLEPFPYKPDVMRQKPPRGPPPRMPSKFQKGEIRESDYESDYDGRIAPRWRPADSGDEEPVYRGVQPPMATAHKSHHSLGPAITLPQPTAPSMPVHEPDVMGIPLPRPMPAMSPPRHKRPSPPRCSPRRSPSAAQMKPVAPEPEFPDSGYTADAENTMRRHQRCSTYSETVDQSFRSQRPATPGGGDDEPRSESPLSVSSFPEVAAAAAGGSGVPERRQESPEPTWADREAALDSAVAPLAAGGAVWSPPEPPAPPSELRLAALLPGHSRQPAATSSSYSQQTTTSISAMSASSVTNVTHGGEAPPPEPELTLQAPVFSKISQQKVKQFVESRDVVDRADSQPNGVAFNSNLARRQMTQAEQQSRDMHQTIGQSQDISESIRSEHTMQKQSKLMKSITEKSSVTPAPDNSFLRDSTSNTSREDHFRQTVSSKQPPTQSPHPSSTMTTSSTNSQELRMQRVVRTAQSTEVAMPQRDFTTAVTKTKDTKGTDSKSKVSEHMSRSSSKRSSSASSSDQARKGLVEEPVVEQVTPRRPRSGEWAAGGRSSTPGRNGTMSEDGGKKTTRETTKTSSHVSRRVSTERRETTRATKMDSSASPPRRNSLTRQHHEQKMLQQQEKQHHHKATKQHRHSSSVQQQKQRKERTTIETNPAAKAVGEQLDSMAQQFRSKAQQLSSQVQADVQGTSASAVATPIEQNAGAPVAPSITNGHDPQQATSNGSGQMSYRNEDRVKDCGSKHVDPGTGLIYFKYDFGYEYGVITPGPGVSGTVASVGGEAGRGSGPVASAGGEAGRGSGPVASAGGEAGRGSVGLATWPAPSLHSPAPGACSVFSGDTHICVDARRPAASTPTPAAQELDGAQLDDLVTSGRLRPESAFGTRTPPNVHVSYPHTDAECSEPEDAGSRPASRLKGILRRPPEPPAAGGPEAPLQRAPVLLRPLTDLYVHRGETIQLKCLVDALPEPQVTWYKDNRVVAAPGAHTGVYQAELLNGICRLSVAEAYAEDAGLFRCVASNRLGSVSTEALVCVAGEK